MKIYLLDNFDSFSYNLVDQFRTLGHQVLIYRNDVDIEYISEKLLAETQVATLVLSPGPGVPNDSGNMMPLVQKLAGQLPILGICLGHQALVQHYGGKINRAPEIVHGKASHISYTKHPVFQDLPFPLPVARYHSLIAGDIPDCLEVIARLDTRFQDTQIETQLTKALPMAVCHKFEASVGFQFHPESILTTSGSQLLINTLKYLTTKTKSINNQESQSGGQ